MVRLLFLACAFSASPAMAAVKAVFKGSAAVRFAEHTSQPMSVASQRADLTAEQKISIGAKWAGVLSGIGWYEGVYASQPDKYPKSLRQADSYEARLQDAWLEFRTGGWAARVGNQQVVWSETFGNVYADIVNPRDLREGMPMDAGGVRRSIPMINLKYVGGSYSLQGLYIVQPEFNTMPLAGSDFVPFRPADVGFQAVDIQCQPLFTQLVSEGGGRISKTFGATDASIFYLSYYDRFPYYKLGKNTVPGQTLYLQEAHAPIQSAGATLASEWEGHVVRVEAVRNLRRTLPVFAGGTIARQISDEMIAVVAVDFPTYDGMNSTLLFSDSEMMVNAPYILRRWQEMYAGLRVQSSLFTASNFEFIITRSLVDKGMRVQAELMSPFLSSFEFRLGADWYDGPGDSGFAQTRRASRVYASVKAFVGGFRAR